MSEAATITAPTATAPATAPSSAAEAPAAPAAEPARLSFSERRQAAMERVKARLQGQTTPAAAQPAAPAESAPATPAEAPAADAAPSAPKLSAEGQQSVREVVESGGSREDIAKAIREAFASDRRAHEAEQRARQLEQEREADRAERERRMADPFYKRVAEGATFQEVSEAAMRGELQPLTPEQVALQKAEERAAALERRLEAIERGNQEAAEKSQREQLLSKARTTLTESAERYPFIAPLGWMPEHAAQYVRPGEVEIDTVYAELNARAERDAQALLSNDRVLERLLQNQELRARVSRYVGGAPRTTEQTAPTTPSATQAQQTAAPRTTTTTRTITHNTAADPVVRSARPPTMSERRAAGIARVNAILGAKG